MSVEGTSNADTPAERLRENAEHALLFTADGKSLSVWAEDALSVLAENQRLEKSEELARHQAQEIDALEAENQRLRDAHNAKSGALQTIYRLATSSTGVRGSVMQQIADAAYSALAAVRVEDER